jgi:hypothetical protein
MFWTYMQSKLGYIRHLLSQPSIAIKFPSSHSSNVYIIAFPHVLPGLEYLYLNIN